MPRFIVTAMAGVALCSASAVAQVSPVGGAPTPSGLGMTSPLGIGAPAPVARTGIPLGATELVPQGTSPGTTPSGLSTNDLAVCSGFSSSVPQASFGAPATGAASSIGTASSSPTGLATVFDGGTTGTASGTCTAGPNFASPTASASSPTGMSAGAPVGRVGIPMGSTELGAGGLSPGPLDVTGTASVSSILSTSTSSMGTSTSSLATSFSSTAAAPTAAPAVATASSAFSSSSSTGTGSTSGGGRQGGGRR
jgi:hypothetical protein